LIRKKRRRKKKKKKKKSIRRKERNKERSRKEKGEAAQENKFLKGMVPKEKEADLKKKEHCSFLSFEKRKRRRKKFFEKKKRKIRKRKKRREKKGKKDHREDSRLRNVISGDPIAMLSSFIGWREPKAIMVKLTCEEIDPFGCDAEKTSRKPFGKP